MGGVLLCCPVIARCLGNRKATSPTTGPHYSAVVRRREILGDTRRYREIQGDTGRYREIQGGTGRYREVQGGTGRCRAGLSLS
jgi:hypothetical protein